MNKYLVIAFLAYFIVFFGFLVFAIGSGNKTHREFTKSREDGYMCRYQGGFPVLGTDGYFEKCVFPEVEGGEL